MQLLPSLLHVLEVETFATDSTISSAFDSGMDWGNIAIYSCPDATCACAQEYCVVQDTVDERPLTQRRHALPNAVIQEGTQFSDDEGTIDEEQSRMDDEEMIDDDEEW